MRPSKLILAAALAAFSVQAQQPAQPSPDQLLEQTSARLAAPARQPSLEQLLEQANARLAVLARQRDDANNRLVIVEAEVMRMQREAEGAAARVVELEKVCGDVCRQKPAPASR